VTEYPTSDLFLDKTFSLHILRHFFLTSKQRRELSPRKKFSYPRLPTNTIKKWFQFGHDMRSRNIYLACGFGRWRLVRWHWLGFIYRLRDERADCRFTSFRRDLVIQLNRWKRRPVFHMVCVLYSRLCWSLVILIWFQNLHITWGMTTEPNLCW
jgi:hypothetical protein